MSPPPTHGRRGVRAGALLGAVVLALLPVAVTGRAAADDEPTPTPTPSTDEEAPLRIRVSSLLPRAPAPGLAFEVVGTVTNVGSQPAAGVKVQLRVGERLSSRGGLAQADTDRPPTFLRRNTAVSPTDVDLAPGQTTAFDLRTTVDRLGLGAAGVYPLDVEATARYGDAGRARLGTAPTFVPWMEGHHVAPTRIAVLWPLVDQPRRGADGTLLDDTLAASVAPTGRLGRLLAAATAAAQGQCDGLARPREGTSLTPPRSTAAVAPRCDPVPVTYAVDPDLLETVQAMTTSYRVARPGSQAVAGSGGAAARRWLASLSAATRDAAVLALPFADPDVAALSGSLDGRYDVSLASTLGNQIVRDLLGVTPLSTTAWPPPGTLPPAAQGAAAINGATALVLDPSAFNDPPDDNGRTPGAQAPLPAVNGSPLTGLVPDAGLSALVAGRSAADLGPRLAEQRWIVETAMIAAEAPSQSRTLLVTPDRRGDVVAGAAAAALHDIGRLPWLCAVPIAQVAAGNEHCPGIADGQPARLHDRGQVQLDPRPTLPATFLAGIAHARDEEVRFTEKVLDPRQSRAIATQLRLRRAVARAESSAWRDNPTAGGAVAGSLGGAVHRLVSGLSVRGTPLLLTSAKGTLSVSVDNRLDEQVTCAVRFTTTAGGALTNPGGVAGATVTTALHTIPPRSSAQLSVQVSARTSGGFGVAAQLVDTTGSPFGTPAKFQVRSTQYGRLALAVTGVGAGVLLVAAGVRIVRRALRSRSSSRRAAA